jgi:hypothetical protein
MLKQVVTIPITRALSLAVASLLTVSMSLPAQAQTNYANVGTTFLNKIQTAYLKTLANSKGSSVALYASTIDPNTGGTKSTEIAQMFSEENMIRALMWGTLVNPTTFRPPLMTSIQQLDWYQGGCQNAAGNNYGYGFSQGQTCFFDDNSQLGGTLMDTYLKINTSSDPALSGNGPTVLAHANTALNYDMYWATQDAHGGVPQKPADLGEGRFYMNVMLTTSTAEADYGKRFSVPADVTYGANYYTEVHNTAMGLLLPSGLFRGSTQFVSGAWVPASTGPLPGDQASVIRLALSLYRSGDTSKLAAAESLMDLTYANWVAASGATNANAVNGGFAIVDALCEVYLADKTHNAQYLADAKSIIDYILANSKDTAGWFPNGTTSTGDWDYVRTGSAPDDSTTLLTQSAAAAAIMEFAWTRQQ